MTASSVSAARFTAAQVDAYREPRLTRTHRKLVVYCHGSSSNGSEIVTGLPSMHAMTKELCDQGYVVVAPTQTALWGNTTSDSRIDDAITWARANLRVHADDPVIIGASHGAACGVQYAVDNDVKALVAIIPAIDLEYARTNNTLSLRASIDTAWSVTYPTPLPAGGNPYDLDPGVPTQVWAASNDAVSTNAEEWADTYDLDYHNLGALGHTDAAIAAVDINELLAFID